MSKVIGSLWFGLAALSVIQAAITACAHRAPSNWELIRGQRPELWAERAELRLVSAVIRAVESQYVDPPDFSRLRLRSFRALERLTPAGAFRVEETADGAKITNQVAGGAPATVRFEPSSSGATVQDLEIATGIALNTRTPRRPSKPR